MELSEALKIVQLLSEEIDPESGGVLEDESTFDEPQVIRAPAVAVGALERVNKIESRKESLPDNAEKARVTEEDNLNIGQERHKTGFFPYPAIRTA